MIDREFIVPRDLGVLEAPVAEIRPRRLEALRSWWESQEDHAKVLIAGLVPLAAGCGMVYLPLAFIVPGAILVAVALGFTFMSKPPSGEG